MSEGIVTNRKFSKKGTPVITINNKDDYYAGTLDVSGIQLGDKIEFQSNEFAPGRYGLQTWKLLVAAQKYPVNPGPTHPTSPPTGLPSGLSEGERATVSNWVANAISAGLIKDRADLGMWAIAAKNALRKAGEPEDEI